MKKIGYIYKYSESEGKGILVHGRWKSQMIICGQRADKDLPIKFDVSDCLSPVKTGELVYFDSSEKKASCIERATLKNFDKGLIEQLLRPEGKHVSSSWYYDNTHISYEDLSDIIIPEEESKCSTTNKKEIKEDDDISSLTGLEIFDMLEDDDSANRGINLKHRSKILDLVKRKNTILPESIDELFNCFGKYEHRYTHTDGYRTRPNEINLDILELSLWVDESIAMGNYFGHNLEEIKYLYDVFVKKQYYNEEGKIQYENVNNDSISKGWQYILKDIEDHDIKELIEYAPKLQPAFPKEFCKKNAGLLSDDYGMPDVEICKLHCLQKISNAKTVSEYKDIKYRLYVYCNCGAEHLEGEGTPMCQMGEKRISNLRKKLDLQYENVIKHNVIDELINLCENANVANEIQNATSDDFNNIALFIDNFQALRNDFLDYKVCKETLKYYEKLPQLYKDALKTSLHKGLNEAAISATKADDLTPFRIRYIVKKLGSWILESTKQKIKELVNYKFSQLDDLEDLREAYTAEYITSKQYYKQYREITREYNTNQFIKELSNYRSEDYPAIIQWYIVVSIIKELGYESLNSFKYVRLDSYDAISDIPSLLYWLNNHGHLKDNVFKKAEERICSVLTDDERWTLFEEEIAKSPGVANIHKRLDEVYKKKSANKEYLKRECFQDVMLSDVASMKDPSTLLFIADNLDSRHQYLMQQNATGFLKLYLWQKQPSANFDWNLVKSHFYELSAEAQIKTLRYIFGLMATEGTTLVLDDLYKEFVETTTPACSAVCGILFILKAKMDNIYISITPAMVESVIGDNLEQRYNFLKDCKQLFYQCNGYQVVSEIQQNIEYQLFNGILKKEIKNNTLYYVISFYNTPVNLFGRTIEWLDSELVDTAIQVLKRNTDVNIINGKYYIPESDEFFVKQFVIKYNIDDKCGLVSDKERMIELGFLPRHNAFQPLYTNHLRKYENSNYYICRCGCEGGADPNNNLPFYWCKKKICTRRAHFFLPPSEWERFCFADILYIVLGQKPNTREAVWRVNAEISQFICDYAIVFRSNERSIYSAPLNESLEKGTWDKNTSTYRNIYDDDDYDYEYGDDYDENYDDDYDKPTYDRYNGSYAQDEMGYSDDDIDTIFDWDPDAYWNID